MAALLAVALVFPALVSSPAAHAEESDADEPAGLRLRARISRIRFLSASLVLNEKRYEVSCRDLQVLAGKNRFGDHPHFFYVLPFHSISIHETKKAPLEFRAGA